MQLRRPAHGLWRWVALGTAALLVVLLALGEALGWPGVSRLLQSSLSRGTGWPTLFEACRARLLTGPSLSCGTIVVGNDRWVDARGVHVEWRWVDLWRWRQGQALRLVRLEAGSLQLRLQRDAQGRANWQRPGAPPDPSAAKDPAWPQIDTLTVASGRLLWDDVPAAIRLDVAMQTLEGGSYRAEIEGRYRELPLALRASSDELLPLLRAQTRGNEVPMSVQGTVGAAQVAFVGRAASLLDTHDLDGALRIAGPSLARVGEPLGVTLPQSPPFELSAQIVHRGGLWRLTETKARIGRSRLGGDFTYDTKAVPPHLSGRLTGERLMLVDLGPSIGAPAPGAAPGARRRVLPERDFDLPSLHRMRAEVDVDVDLLDLNTSAMAPLRRLRTKLQLQDGHLVLQQLSAQVAGGSLRGQTSLDTRQNSARWAAKLRFDDVDVTSWFPVVRKPAAAGARGGADAAQAYVTGTLGTDVDVRGAGRSTAQILSSLDGQIETTLSNGTLSHLVTEAVGLDVAQALGVAIRGDSTLPLRCAIVRLQLRNGIAQVNPGVIDNRDSTLRIGGSISMVDETLALVVRARPKDVSPLSLRAPVTVTGPWRDPVVGVQGRSLAGKVLGAAVLAATVAPAAALLALFDPGEKNTSDPCAVAPAKR